MPVACPSQEQSAGSGGAGTNAEAFQLFADADFDGWCGQFDGVIGRPLQEGGRQRRGNSLEWNRMLVWVVFAAVEWRHYSGWWKSIEVYVADFVARHSILMTGDSALAGVLIAWGKACVVGSSWAVDTSATQVEVMVSGAGCRGRRAAPCWRSWEPR